LLLLPTTPLEDETSPPEEEEDDDEEDDDVPGPASSPEFVGRHWDTPSATATVNAA